MKIGIYARNVSDDFVPSLKKLFDLLSQNYSQIWIYSGFYNFLINKGIVIDGDKFFYSSIVPDNLSFIITIGGDGTFLEAVSVIRFKQIPLLGINTGRLGFLADVLPEEIPRAIEDIVNNKYSVEYRSMIKVVVEPSQDIDFPFALNDLTVHKRDTSSMIKIEASIDNVFLANYWADGLIVSTPTGSTAYSMSAGGPIVSPDAQNLILTPIASHNLTVRPLVIPDSHKISLKIESRDSKFLISLDTRSYVIDEELEIIVEKIPSKVSMIKLNNHNYYTTLRDKLMWGVDKRNL